MQIQINMNTIDKYIHAQEVTVTKANPVLDTSLLSTKGKELLVKLQENSSGFYFKLTETVLNDLAEEIENSEPEEPIITYSINALSNVLTVTFSEAVKYNGFPLEDYTGTVIDFIKNTSQPNQSLSLLDQALDETKLVLTTTATSYTLTLEPNFFNKNIFKALDDSFVGGPDEWAGNEDGFYRIDFLFKPEAFTSLTDVVVPANTSDPTVDELKITVYTTASETVTQHTAEDYENSDILGVFDDTPIYSEE